MNNINQLPNKILAQVLDRVPVTDLLRNSSRVCSHWRRVQMSVCSKKRSLILLPPAAAVTLKYIHMPIWLNANPHSNDTLRMQPKGQSLASLARLPFEFTNLKRLTIFRCIVPTDALRPFLSRFAFTLESLSLLRLQGSHNIEWTRIWHCLILARKLKYLDLANCGNETYLLDKILPHLSVEKLVLTSDSFHSFMLLESLPTIRTLQLNIPAICPLWFSDSLLSLPNIEQLFIARQTNLICPNDPASAIGTQCPICPVEMKKLWIAFPQLCWPLMAPLTRDDVALYASHPAHARIRFSEFGKTDPTCEESIPPTLPPKEASNINDLPDACLIAILDAVGMNDLFKCALVCRRWTQLEPRVCERKTTLRLFDLKPKSKQSTATKMLRMNLELIAHYPWRERNAHTLQRLTFNPFHTARNKHMCRADITLAVPQFNIQVCRTLCRKYPNIKRFFLYYTRISAADLYILLAAWAAQLETLFIWTPAHCVLPLTQYRLKFQSLSPLIDQSMPRLRRLFLKNIIGDLVLPSRMAHLEEFALHEYDYGNMPHALQKLDPSHLKSLTISHSYRTVISPQATLKYLGDNRYLFEGSSPLSPPNYPYFVLWSLFGVRPKLFDSLTQLTLYCDSYGMAGVKLDCLQFVCKQMRALEKLSICLQKGISIGQVFYQLCKLCRLAHFDIASSDLALFENVHIVTHFRLSSITTFGIKAPLSATQFAFLAPIMPELKYVNIFHQPICVRTNRLVTYENFADHFQSCSQCANGLRAAWSQFPNLAPIEV